MIDSLSHAFHKITVAIMKEPRFFLTCFSISCNIGMLWNRLGWSRVDCCLGSGLKWSGVSSYCGVNVGWSVPSQTLTCTHMCSLGAFP